VVHTADTPSACKEFDQLLDERHYLGGECQGGDYLRQVVYRDGRPVALLAWGAACYALKDRDERIGWNPKVRAERLKLVAQNRRFLLLTERGEEPNLASQVLGAALRALPGQWLEHFGYEPLAAETFSDIEAFAGTCYKAAGWEPLGLTKGYSRHRADFFTPNGKPKKLWFKFLRKDAPQLLRAPELPPECRAGARGGSHGVLPLRTEQVDSLFEALLKVPDPRAGNRAFSLPAVFCIVVMAQLSGRVDLSSIHRFGQSLSQPQRKQLGLPFKTGTKFRRAPGYNIYWRLLKRIDPEALAEVLSAWLAARQGSLPGDLAMDGKMIGTVAGIVSLVDTETGVARATAPMRHKEEGPDGEQTCARKLIENAGALEGQTVSGDALHAQGDTARAILRQGGEYLLQIKANQPTLLETARNATANRPPFARR
jgi:hypothetical protein